MSVNYKPLYQDIHGNMAYFLVIFHSIVSSDTESYETIRSKLLDRKFSDMKYFAL